MGHEGVSEDACDVLRLSAGFTRLAGCLGKGCRQSLAFSRSATATDRRNGPGPGAGRERTAERQDVRPVGPPQPAVVRTDGCVWQFDRLEDQRRRRQVSPGPVHRVAPFESVSVDDHLRRSQPGYLHRSPAKDQHAVAGARDSQRRRVCRGRPGPCEEDDHQRRRHPQRAIVAWFPSGPHPAGHR